MVARTRMDGPKLCSSSLHSIPSPISVPSLVPRYNEFPPTPMPLSLWWYGTQHTLLVAGSSGSFVAPSAAAAAHSVLSSRPTNITHFPMSFHLWVVRGRLRRRLWSIVNWNTTTERRRHEIHSEWPTVRQSLLYGWRDILYVWPFYRNTPFAFQSNPPFGNILRHS